MSVVIAMPQDDNNKFRMNVNGVVTLTFKAQSDGPQVLYAYPEETDQASLFGKPAVGEFGYNVTTGGTELTITPGPTGPSGLYIISVSATAPTEPGANDGEIYVEPGPGVMGEVRMRFDRNGPWHIFRHILEHDE